MKNSMQAVKFLETHEWTKILVLGLSVRLFWTLIVGQYALGVSVPVWDTGLYKFVNLADPQVSALEQFFLSGWMRWDTGYFIKIAIAGYSALDGTTGFAPLYPILIRILAPIIGGGNYLLTALIISNGFAFSALILLYLIAKQELKDKKNSFKAVVLFVAFPTAFYLFAAYPESLFFTLVFASWLSAKNGKWLLSGIIGSLAVLARFQGVTISIMLSVYWGLTYFSERNRDKADRELEPGRSFFVELKFLFQKAVSDPNLYYCFLPILVYFVYQFWFGNQFEGVSLEAYETYWNNPLIAPWTAIRYLFLRISNGNLSFIDISNLMVVFWFFVLVGLGWKKINHALLLYSLSTLVIAAWLSLGRLSIQPIDGAILMSLSRYVLSLFPLFFVWADNLINKRRYLIWILISFIIQAFLLWTSTLWYFVS